MTYNLQFAAAWAVAVVGIIAGVLAGAALTPFHPLWLTTDVAATMGIISAICVGLAAMLPQVHRTPAVREAAYLNATMGRLPDDLAAKHPEFTTPIIPAAVLPPVVPPPVVVLPPVPPAA